MEEPSLGDRVAAELRAERAKKQVKISDLAKLAGVGERTMQRYLLGTRDINVQVLDDICRALGVSVGDIMERATRPLPSENGTGSLRRSG